MVIDLESVGYERGLDPDFRIEGVSHVVIDPKLNARSANSSHASRR
jgi:hypothetical protein